MAEQKESSNTRVNINLDKTPILYTDNIGITANQDGVVFDVMQRLGNTGNIRIVARIGMSKNQAQKFSLELGKMLAMTLSSKDLGKRKN